MSFQTITPEEANKLLGGDSGHIYIDVRSSHEFKEGHATGAQNVPLAEIDEATGQMLPNPDFERVMLEVYPKGEKLILACAAGGRSQAACHMLESHGYEQLFNMHGGFLGARDPYGNLIQEGWQGSGYPTAAGDDECVTYASILQKLKGS